MKLDPSLRKKELEELSVEEDHQRIVHLLVGYEFPWDMRRALEMALFKTFSSPSISSLLQKTKEFNHAGQKRYDDTGLLISEFFKHGYDSVEGTLAIERINHLHQQYPISNDDYLFVLSTFVLDPINWMNNYAWRAMTSRECEALYLFWKKVGERMGINDIPDTLSQLKEFANQYTVSVVAYDEKNKKMAEATLNIIKRWVPKGFRWMVYPAVNALINDSMRVSFGFAQPSKGLQLLLKTLLKLRGLFVLFLPKRKSSDFYSDTKTRTYPIKQYDVQKLGPNAIKK